LGQLNYFYLIFNYLPNLNLIIKLLLLPIIIILKLRKNGEDSQSQDGVTAGLSGIDLDHLTVLGGK